MYHFKHILIVGTRIMIPVASVIVCIRRQLNILHFNVHCLKLHCYVPNGIKIFNIIIRSIMCYNTNNNGMEHRALPPSDQMVPDYDWTDIDVYLYPPMDHAVTCYQITNLTAQFYIDIYHVLKKYR